MERIKRWLIRVLERECGQDMVEYAMVIATISVPIVFVAIVFGPAFSTWATKLATCITAAGTGTCPIPGV